MTSISGLCPADPAQGTPLKRQSTQAPSLPPSKVSLIFSLPWIQVIAPRPLSQAPQNVTNFLPSFTGPVTWEVFIAQQPVSLSCSSAALPQAITPHAAIFASHPVIPLTGQNRAGWEGPGPFEMEGGSVPVICLFLLSTPETLASL